MAFDNITTKVNLVAGDTSAIDAAARQERAINDLTAAVGRTDAKMVDLGKTQRSSFEFSKRLTESALRDFKAQTDAIEAQDRAYQELIDSARELLETQDQTAAQATQRPAEIRGETIGKIGQLAGLAGVAGGAQAGQAASVLLEGQRALGLLGDVGKDAFNSIKDLVTAIPPFTGGLFGAIPAISGVTIGIGALTVAAGAVVAITGAVIAFGNEIRQVGDDAREATAAYIAERDARRAVRDEQLTTIELQERLADAEKRRADAQADIDKAAEVRALAFQRLQSEQVFDPGDLNAKLGFAAAEAAGVFAALDEDAKKAADALTLAQGEIEAYNAALTDGTAVTNDLRAATEETITAEKDLAAQREQNAARLAALEQQEADLIAAFELGQRQRAEDLARSAERDAAANALKIARADADLQATLEAQAATHADKMKGIAEAGDAAIEALQSSIAQKQIDAAQAVLDAQKTLASESAAAAQKFQREELRRLEQFNLDRIQSERRFRLSQDQAVRANDIEALLEGRRNRNLERKEAQENFDAISKERSQDFELERAERERATAERIAAINAELTTFTAATNARIQQEARSIAERQRLEQKAFNEQQQRDAAARALRAQRDAEDAAIRQRIQEEDRAIAEARQQEALNRQLARIDQEQAKLTQVATVAVAARSQELTLLELIIQRGQAALTAFNASPLGALNPFQPPAPTATSASGFGVGTGGFSNQLGLPSASLAGAAGKIIRAPQSDIRGLASVSRGGGSGGSGANINLNVTIPNVNVGSVVSSDEARRIAGDVANGASDRVLKIVKDGLRMAKQVGA